MEQCPQKQQAPAGGCGQKFGVQLVPGPCQLPEQWTWIVTVQTPVPGSQQAPVGGGGQRFGVQLVPAPCHTLGAWQPACVVKVQTPVDRLQQAPPAHPWDRAPMRAPQGLTEGRQGEVDSRV